MALNHASVNFTNKTMIDLYIRCTDLPDLDVLSKSDPQVRVYLRDSRTGGREKLIGETEIIWDNLNPKFAKTIALEYYFEEAQYLRFECIDIDSNSFDLIGNVKCTLGEIIGSRGGELARIFEQPHSSSKHNKPGRPPILIVRAEERTGTNADVHFDFYANGLDKKDLFGKSDPLLEIHRVNSDGSQLLVHRTEFILKTLDPHWKPFSVPLNKLCNGDEKKPLVIKVWDWNKSGKYDFIGECRVSLEMLKAEKQWDLINPEKTKKKKYVNSGVLRLQSIRVVQNHSFIEYIIGGMQVNLVIGIDYTASNGNPAMPNSLHFRGPSGNQYTKAIQSITEILLAYDSDGLVPVYGFGGRLPNGVTSHCFALTGDPAKPEVVGVNGVMAAYTNSFTWVALHGPTNFAPLINQVAATAEDMDSTQDDYQSYVILLIITDGEITDMANTTDAIVRASLLPISIIIVGVGNADFTKMNILDGDDVVLTDGRGRRAARDIVQFVPFNQYANNPAALAAAVLEEVPEQVTSYMKSKGISPKVRAAASSHDLQKLMALQQAQTTVTEVTQVTQQVSQVSIPPQQAMPSQQQAMPPQQQQQMPPQQQQIPPQQNQRASLPPQGGAYMPPQQQQQGGSLPIQGAYGNQPAMPPQYQQAPPQQQYQQQPQQQQYQQAPQQQQGYGYAPQQQQAPPPQYGQQQQPPPQYGQQQGQYQQNWTPQSANMFMQGSIHSAVMGNQQPQQRPPNY